MRPLVALALVVAASCGGSSPASSDAAPFDSSPPPVDARTMCPTIDGAPSECDYFLSCNCALPGQKCTAGLAGPACGPAAAFTAGTACTSDSQCVPGTVCASVGAVTQCLRFCDATHPCGGTLGCYITINDSQSHVIATACGPTCSLLDQDCSMGSQGCYIAQGDRVPERGICLTAGSGGQGTQCNRSTECQKGYLCTRPAGGGASVCAKMCDRQDGQPACEAGTTCHPLEAETQTGICLP